MKTSLRRDKKSLLTLDGHGGTQMFNGKEVKFEWWRGLTRGDARGTVYGNDRVKVVE